MTTRKPLILVDLNDTIEAWRQKTNSLSQYIGSLDNISVPTGDSAGGYSDIVTAVNSVSSKIDPVQIKQEISLNATNSSHTSLSYNPTTGVFTFVSNEIDGSYITDIEAEKITTGTLNTARIPNLDAGKITTGTIDEARLPPSALQPSGEIFSTDSLAEGSLNLYYTDTRARSAISTASPTFIGYDQATGEISWTGPSLEGNQLIAGTGVNILNGNQISIGQNVSTSSSVAFGSITSTGSITGASIAGNMIATSAQATAGTATNVAMTPQRVQESVTKSWNDHVMLITWEFATSTGLSNSTFYDLLYDADGDGENDFGSNQYPDFVELELVCRSSEHGWSIGDVIKVAPTADPALGNNGITVKKNHLTSQPATGRSRQCMQIRVGEDGPGQYGSATSGAGNVLTASNWYMRVRGLKFKEYRASTNGNTTLYSFVDPGTGAIKSVSFTETGGSTTPLTPTYSLSGPGAINEGATGTFNVTTSNVPDNTLLYWTIEPSVGGAAPSASDFTALSGTVTVSGGSGTFTITASADQTTEGNETYRIFLRTSGFTGAVVAQQNSFVVNDTSITFVQPPLTNTGQGDQECFVPSALVVMSDNTTKPIEEIVVGDFVFGRDGIVNEVVEVRTREVETKFYAFNGVDYFVTPSHPFLTTDGWKSMDVSLAQQKYPNLNITQLEVGDELIMYNTESERYYEQQIFAINDETFSSTVYNLNVSGEDTPDKDGNDTYIVNGYVVHNK